MPLTRNGELKFVAFSDLHGLGANEGPQVTYQWTRPSLLPALLPWLGVLLVLCLRPNRTAQSWWILLPLASVLVMEAALRALLTFIPSEIMNLLGQVVYALAFGVTITWLIAPFLGGPLRFVVFLKILILQIVVCLLAWAANQGWGESGGEQIGTLICLGILTLAIAAALCLAGFHCRRRYHPARFLLGLILSLLATVALAVLPFAGFAAVFQGAEVWLPFVVSILVGAGVSCTLLLPFLVLCHANPFYRQRLGDLLRMAAPLSPPLLPSTEATPEPTL